MRNQEWSFRPRNGDMFFYPCKSGRIFIYIVSVPVMGIYFFTKTTVSTIISELDTLFPSPSWGYIFLLDNWRMKEFVAKCFRPHHGDIFFTLPLRNRITKPLKIHFPAEIAVLKNSVKTNLQRCL